MNSSSAQWKEWTLWRKCLAFFLLFCSFSFFPVTVSCQLSAGALWGQQLLPLYIPLWIFRFFLNTCIIHIREALMPIQKSLLSRKRLKETNLQFCEHTVLRTKKHTKPCSCRGQVQSNYIPVKKKKKRKKSPVILLVKSYSPTELLKQPKFKILA